MTERKNFSGQTTPSIVDTEYRECNFAVVEPIDNGDGTYSPVPIDFPEGHPPVTFEQCNLMNREMRPGDTRIGGLQILKKFAYDVTVVESTRTGPRYQNGTLLPDDGSTWGNRTQTDRVFSRCVDGVWEDIQHDIAEVTRVRIS